MHEYVWHDKLYTAVAAAAAAVAAAAMPVSEALFIQIEEMMIRVKMDEICSKHIQGQRAKRRTDEMEWGR